MPIRYSPQEAAELFPEGGWRKARKSGGAGGEGCVEVNLLARQHGRIGVRDSKLDNSPTLVFDPHEWECFLDGAKNGEFDLGV